MGRAGPDQPHRPARFRVIRAIFILAVLMLLPAWLALPALAFELEASQVGDWRGGAYADDQSGQFSHCGVEGHEANGIWLIFFLGADGSWDMAFSDSKWQLQTGSRFQLRYRIDDDLPITTTGDAVTTTAIRVVLPADGTVQPRLRQGDLLHLDVADESVVFKLNGTGRAFDELMACAARWQRAAQSLPTASAAAGDATTAPAPATVGSTAQAPAIAGATDQNAIPSAAPPAGTATMGDATAGRSPAVQAEAAAFLRALLDHAGLAQAKLSRPDVVRRIMPTYDAAFNVDRVMGAAAVIAAPDRGLVDQVIANMISNAAVDCTGKFATRRDPIDPHGTGAVLGHLATACQLGAKAVHQYYLFLPRAAGGMYIVYLADALGGPDDVAAGTAGDFDEQIMRSLVGTPGDTTPAP